MSIQRSSSRPLSLSEINQQNQEFWATESALTHIRICDETLYKMALRDMERDAAKFAFRERQSLDAALAHAEKKRDVLRALAPVGGSAAKTDNLNVFIHQCVQGKAAISERELYHEIKKQVGRGVIVSIDNHKIVFINYNQKLKTALVSGLKDRLFRARLK
jgi:hypothetical protein